MRYLFTRKYNPAYDVFLIKYFQKAGIEFDENMTFQEVEPRWLLAFDGRNLNAPEQLFRDYVSAWRFHHEARPAFEHLFVRAVAGKPRLDFSELVALESQLEPRQGKLLFSEEEVASDMANFYRRYVREPLRRAVEGGVAERELLRFFTLEELQTLPKPRVVGEEKAEEATYRKAGDVFLWADGITAERILHDIDRVLKAHEDSPLHIKLASCPQPDYTTKVNECEHKSDYVQLGIRYEVGSGFLHTLLIPARGFNLSDYEIERGWNEVVFPWYCVRNSKS